MKVSDLIKELEELQQEHGDLEIRVWSDHGQSCMRAAGVGLQMVDEDGETYHEDDWSDYEGQLEQVIEIYGVH